MYVDILDLKPTNLVMGTPKASSLHLPITFLFVLSKNYEFSGYSQSSNLSITAQKSLQTSSVSISNVELSVSEYR